MEQQENTGLLFDREEHYQEWYEYLLMDLKRIYSNGDNWSKEIRHILLEHGVDISDCE